MAKSYALILVISAPLEIVAEEGDKTIVKASYSPMLFDEGFENMLAKAIQLVENQFAQPNGRNKAVISFKGEEHDSTFDISAVYLGHTEYAPLGIEEIPLVILQTSNIDVGEQQRLFSIETSKVRK